MINVYRVKSRVESGGHDVPADKIISRYDRALELVKDLVNVCDICHIYDNSEEKPFRILKKRKECFYYDECEDWYLEDIQALTGVIKSEKKELN
jgi:predicted ABC-type ATPase